jgi:CheY-like chemotaxis protein
MSLYTPPRIQRARILVVEDDPIIREMLGELLAEELSYTVRLVPTGRAALQLPMDERPDVMILDYLLEPGMTGIAVYDRLHARADWQDIPAIMVSATPPWEALRARALTCVPKPFDVDTLLAVVDNALPLPSAVGYL